MSVMKEKTDYGTPLQIRNRVRGPAGEIYHFVEVMENTEDEMYATDRARNIMKLLPITASAAIISSFAYWKLYVGQLLIFRSRGQNMNARLFFAMIDLLVASSVAIKALLDSIAILTPNVKRPYLRLTGSVAPMVDIIITTCNEDVDICLDTIRAAMNIDYPLSKFRVLVADDGACSELKQAVEDISAKASPQRLFYTSRVKGKDDRHKAANLNHALRVLSKLPGGSSPYVAGFDADMIAERQFLRASMPHLLKDPNLGFTCPAATYYNNATNDPLLQSQTVVNKFEECFRDRVNNAWNTGSGWVCRRDALDNLGGFPMKDIAEDVHCSSGILNLGYNAAFLSESLQFGLVPDGYKGHLKQHRQWKLGGLQIGLAMKFGLFGKQVKGMSWNQRLYWFFFPFKALTSPLVTLGLFTSPLFMLADIPWIIYDTPADLKHLTQTSAVAFLCAFFFKCHIAVLTGFKASLMENCNDIWMAPYHTVTQMRTYILPSWLGGKLFTFIPTGTIPNELNERSKARRSPLHNRLRLILLTHGAIFHCFYSLFCLVAVGCIVSRAVTNHPEDSVGQKVYLLTHLGWIPLPWFFSAFACLTPLRYAIFPPTVPEREDLLERDPQTNVAYPVKEARRVRWEFEIIGFQNLYIVAAIYCAGLLYSTSMW